MNGAQAVRYWHSLISTLRRGGMSKPEAVKQVEKETQSALPGLRVKQPILYYDLGWRTGITLAPPDKGCLKVKVLAPDRTVTDEKTGKPKLQPRPPVFVPLSCVRFIDPRNLRRPWGLL